jgi:3-dehydroquinate synthase
MGGLRFVQYNLSVKSSNFAYQILSDKSALLTGVIRGIVICDVNVEKTTRELFPDAAEFIALTINENEKTLEGVSKLLMKLAQLNVVREDTLIAVGGGALQDLVTLASSIYMRGLKWIYVPTTLMAMLDSCIGGKSSINLGKYKNLVGNFHPPTSVYIDLVFLETLNNLDIACGIAEGVKICYAASMEDSLQFQSLIQNWRTKKDQNSLREAIFLSLEKKKWFIEIDEFDKKERKLLNFGHSFGHALEAATDFQVPHGIGVLIGMKSALNFAENPHPTLNLMNGISQEVRLVKKEIGSLQVSQEKFLNALRKDKKNSSTELCLILPENSGILIEKFFNLSSETLERCFDSLVRALNELELSHEIL